MRGARLPWWGHVVVLTLIVGGTTASVVTGNPIFAWLLVSAAWAAGAAIARRPRPSAIRDSGSGYDQ